MTVQWRTKAQARAERASLGRVALVPTMGALHDGHLSLVELARSQADAVVVSIFVNPTQFGPGEDFERYPRTFAEDLARLEAAGVDAVFAPDAREMYPDGLSGTTVHGAPAALTLEGAFRPSHFDGMLTVVHKLLGIVEPDVAVFGEKDAQQLFLIRAMVRDLDLDVTVVGAPIVREADGLALSSRNRYLSVAERERALGLSHALEAAARAFADAGVAAAREGALRALAAAGAAVDYVALVDPETFAELEGGTASVVSHSRPEASTGADTGPDAYAAAAPGADTPAAEPRSAQPDAAAARRPAHPDVAEPHQALALIAARIGATRLIDNRLLTR